MRSSPSAFLNSEAQVLGRFVPSELSESRIKEELRPLLPPCCCAQTIGVRAAHGYPVEPLNLEWHQDGFNEAGERVKPVAHLILWANETPTEIRTSTWELLQFEPFDLIQVDNYKAFHRQPAGTNPHSRWFVLVHCLGGN